MSGTNEPEPAGPTIQCMMLAPRILCAVDAVAAIPEPGQSLEDAAGG